MSVTDIFNIISAVSTVAIVLLGSMHFRNRGIADAALRLATDAKAIADQHSITLAAMTGITADAVQVGQAVTGPPAPIAPKLVTGMILIAAMGAASLLSACGPPTDSAGQPTLAATGISVGMAGATAAEAVYAANPKADPAVVARLKSLLTAAQAAQATWETAPASSANTVALQSTLAALVAYETATLQK